MSAGQWCRRCRATHPVAKCPRAPGWKRRIRDPHRTQPVRYRDRQRVKRRAFCEWCSAYLGEGGEIDHIVALADGGTSDVDNLQLLCRACHRQKTAEENRARRKR